MQKKVLIVDDEPDLCKILSFLFKGKGFEVLVANDGLAGLNMAKLERPDIIILDLMLPKLHGEEVCKAIRKDPEIQNTPIIMLTGKASEVDTVIGRVIGADVYMGKPCEIKDLLKEVFRLTEKRELSAEEKEMQELKKKLFTLLNEKALKRGKFVLSSGKTSVYYLDGRVITLTPEGAFLTASIILHLIKSRGINALGGPTLGADPIVGAVAALSHIHNVPLKTFIVRKAAKEHGTGKQIEGPELKPGEKVILVDDVATTGKALIEAKEALDKQNILADKAIVIVDRNEGAKENLEKYGIKLESIFNIKDFDL